MRLINDIKLDFKDVLICPKRSTLSSRSEVDLTRSFTFLNSKQSWTGVPIMAANMHGVGSFEIAEKICPLGLITCMVKNIALSDWKRFSKDFEPLLKNMAVSSGCKEGDFELLQAILSEVNVGFINLDVANGYTQRFNQFVKRVRSQYPKKTIIAGNVATGEMVEELLLSGADIVKVGIGSGSVCTTRIKTGVGYPQLSAVIECADAAHGLKGMIISDGGCVCPGDISKAFGAGADFVMLGGMLAGHEENGGMKEREADGTLYKSFHGMSSQAASRKEGNRREKYRAWEGKEVMIPLRGSICETMGDILGGIRSTCTYVGAKALRELSKRTTFIRVSMQENLVFGRE